MLEAGRLPADRLIELEFGRRFARFGIVAGGLVPVDGVPLGRERAGETGGGSGGSPMCRRIRRTGSGSVTAAISRMSLPHTGQISGRIASIRAVRTAHRSRACAAGGVSAVRASGETPGAGGTMGPADPSNGNPARAVTALRSGTLGASTPRSAPGQNRGRECRRSGTGGSPARWSRGPVRHPDRGGGSLPTRFPDAPVPPDTPPCVPAPAADRPRCGTRSRRGAHRQGRMTWFAGTGGNVPRLSVPRVPGRDRMPRSVKKLDKTGATSTRASPRSCSSRYSPSSATTRAGCRSCASSARRPSSSQGGYAGWSALRGLPAELPGTPGGNATVAL